MSYPFKGGNVGVTHYMPIVLEVSKAGPKIPLPMKFNHEWLKEEDYNKMIEETWHPLSEDAGQYFMQQFYENIGKNKKSHNFVGHGIQENKWAAITKVE